MSALSALPNVGKVLEANLIRAGITTPEQLRSIGAEEAFLRIRLRADAGACLNMLYGIEGAVEGIQDKYLPEPTKEKLRKFYNAI